MIIRSCLKKGITAGLLILLLFCNYKSFALVKNFPFWFIKNEGQFQNGSKYCLRTASSYTYFYDQYLVHQFISGNNHKDSNTHSILNLRVDFKNCNTHPIFEERDKSSSKSNFFIGENPSSWKTDVTSFNTLVYKELYKNVDLIYYNLPGGVKSDFIIKQNGSISDITLNYSGVNGLLINGNGDLILNTVSGEITEKIPEAYQIINGKKILVTVRYYIENGNDVKFKVENYNTDYELIIDPQLIYCSYFGGTGDDIMFAGDIERDATGNIYFTGRTTSFDFPVTAGSYSSSNSGGNDVFVVKMNPQGTQIIFSTFIGGPGNDYGYGIELSGPGNDIIVTGVANSGFPVTSGSYQTSYLGGSCDAFILKLNNSGNSLLFSTYLGGTMEDYAFQVTLDVSQNIYVVGQTSSEFPTTPGAYQALNGGGAYDIFISKLNSTGSALLNSTMIGLNAADRGISIALDVSNNVYITGIVQGVYPTTAGVFDNTFNGGYDIVVSKFDPTLTNLIYSTFLGSPGDDMSRSALFIDNSNNAILFGKAGSGFPMTAGSYQQVFGGGATDGLIVKLNSTGSSLVYSTYLGGNGDEYIINADLNIDNEIFVTGLAGNNFPITSCAYDNTFNGGTGDAFVAKLNPSVSQLLYSSYLGGNNTDQGMGILSYNDSVFIVGETRSSNLPVTSNSFDPTFNGGGNDIFLAKILLECQNSVASFIIPDTVCLSENVTVQNTSTGGTTNYWNFCSTNLSNVPIGANLGNLGSLNRPVYSTIAQEGNNYFVFITNYQNGTLTRLSFGNSLTNTPVSTNLGSLGGILLINIEGIQIEKDPASGNWYGQIAGGPNNVLFTLSFGNSLNNTPTATNIGNIGNLMNYPHSMYTFREGTTWYSFIGNYSSSSLIRLNYGNSLANTPTAINIGNIGSLDGPVGFYPIIDNNNWYLFVTNQNNNTLSRLSFGNSLLNTATGVNLGNINGTFNDPRSITIIRDCNEVYGFIVNRITNDIVRLTYPNGLTSIPVAQSLGNIADFVFPHNISELFRVGDSLFAFVMNVNSSTISRIFFPSCINSTIPSSILQNPPPFSYNAPGTYNISLVVDEGLPTQSNACKNIVVIEPPIAVISGNNTICAGNALILSSNSSPGYTYLWTGPNGFTSTNQTITIPNATTNIAGTYTLIISYGGCTSDPVSTIVSVTLNATVNAGPDALSCDSSPITLSGAFALNYTTLLWTTSGNGIFNDITALNPTYTPSTSDVTAGNVILTLTSSSPTCGNVTDQVTLTFSQQASTNAGPDNSTCQSQPFTITLANATNATSVYWSSNGTGNISNANTLSPTYAPGAGETGNITLTITATSSAPCPFVTDFMILTVNPSPFASAGSDANVCEGSSYSITDASVSNYISFSWSHNGTGSLINTTTLTPTYIPGIGETGIITITLSATGDPPCLLVNDFMTLTIHAQPNANAGSNGSICSGSSYTISGATAQNYTSILWSHNGAGTLLPLNSLNPTYTPALNETGNITFTLSAYGMTPCNAVQSQTTLTIVPSVNLFAGPDAATCQGSSFTITSATSSNSFSTIWTSNGSGTLLNSNTLTPTYIPGLGETGVILLTIVAQGLSPCPAATDAMQLHIESYPTAFAGNNSSICQNSVFNIQNALATNYSNYSWAHTGTGYFTSSNTLTPIYHPGSNETGIINITLTVFGLSNCNPASHSLSLTIDPLPLANAGLDGISCQGLPYSIIGADPQNYSQIQWIENGLGSLANANSISPVYNPNPTETGIVLLTINVTGSLSCINEIASDSRLLNINPLPIVNAGNDNRFCSADSYLLSGTQSNCSSVQWSTSGDGSFISINSLNARYFPGLNDITSGNVVLTITGHGSGQCSIQTESDDVSFIIDQMPTVFSGLDESLCVHDPVLLAGATANYYSSLHWTGGDGIFNDDSALSPTYMPGAIDFINGQVILTLSVHGLQSCISKFVSDSKILSVSPYPTVYGGNDDYICSDKTQFQLGANAQNINNLSVLWTQTGGDGYFDDPTILNPVYFPGLVDLSTINREIQFNITANGIGNCSSVQVNDQIHLLIDPIPLSDAGSSGSVCGRNEFQLVDDSAIYEQSINWSSSGDGLFLDNSLIHPVYVPGTTDPGKTIQLTMHTIGCKGMISDDSMLLTVHPDPTATISGTAAICQGTSTQINVFLSGSPPWNISYSDGLIPVTINGILSSPYLFSLSPTSNTSLWLTAANDQFCPVQSVDLLGSANITVNPLPNIYNVTASNNAIFCDGDPGVQISLDNSEIGMIYELLYNNLPIPAPLGPFIMTGTGSPLTYGWFTQVGQYSVLATNPAASCNAMMNDSINVVMNPIPVVDFTSNNACSGDTTVFTITSTGGFIDRISTWQWDFGDGDLITLNAPVNPVKHIYPSNAIYQVTLSVTDTNGCHYTLTHPVVVLEHPMAFFNFDTPNCFGITTQFTDLCQNPPGQGYLTQWIWNFGDGSPVQTINFPPMPVPYNPTHTYTSPGTYMVTLTVSNSKGCSDTYQAPVTIARLPVAGFSYQGNCQDLATAFFDNSNPNGGGQITGWHWDFGDAISGTPNTSLLQYPSHTYSVPGPYTVTLIITNLNGCKDTIAKGIMVKTSPLVDFTNDTACLGTATHFWADTLVSDPLAIAQYLWDFGDNNTSLVRNASNTYVAPGTYTVSLTITDTAGCSNVKTHTITVHPSPVAHFTATNTTCQGQVVTFTDQSVANSAYMSRWVWDFGDGSPPQTFTFPALPPNPNTTYTYTNPGTFGVTLTVTNSDGCTHSETRVIEVLSAPVADFSSSDRCVSTAVSFTDKSAVVLPQALSSWRWNFGEPSSGTANTSTLQNPVHTYSTVNTFTVTLITFTANGCSDTITHDVTTQALPVVDFTFTSACMGNPVQFSPGAGMSPGAIGNWLWSFGDGGTAGTQAPVHTYTAPGTYNITLSVTDTAGCSNVKTGSITIKPSPDASFSISGPGCQGDTIRFINTTAVLPSGFIARYLWNFGDGNTQSVFFPSSPDVTHQYFNSGTFNVSLLVVSSDSCSDTYSGIVTIQPRPTAAFMHGSACQGGAVQFTDISNSNTTGSISGWAWDFGDAASGTANQSTLQNPAHTYNTSGTYTVLLSVTLSGGCSDDTTMQVVVAAPPTVDFTSVAGCNGDTTEFTSTVNPAGTQGWFWQFGDGGTSVIPDPIHIYANAGTYQVILTITDTAGCVNSKTKAVVVAPAPLAAFAVSSPGCSGLPVILTDLSSASGGSLGTWYWTFGDGNDTTYNSVLPTFTHTYTQPGTFTITLKVITATGCENTTTHTAIISASPIADFNYGGTCQGQSTQFTDITNLNGGGTLTQHTWNFGDPASGIQNTSTQTNPVHTYALAGTYTVVLTTVNASGCNDSVSRSVVISPKPGVDFYADSLVCMGSTTTFYTDTTATQVAAVTYYNWDFGDGGPHAFTRNASHSYTVAGTYTVRLTIQDTLGCGNTITHPVTIHPSPITQFVFSGVCENSPTHFTDLSIPPTGDTIVSWYWDFGVNGITTDTSTLQNPKFTYTLPATYSITLTTRTEHGCANTKVLPLQVWNTPTAWFKYTSSPCTNGLVQFQDSSWSYQGIINSWQWEFEPFQFGTGTNPSHLYFAVDSCYDVRLSVTDLRGCVDTTVLNVCVLPPFTVDFTNTNTCFGNAVAFTPQLITPAAPADTLITFHWDFGDPATGTQNISTLKKPAHTFSKAGFYTVNFTSTDKFGCTASQFHSIQVLALPVAGFGYTSGSCDSTITFANTSVDTSAALNMYVWMYGDGTPADTLYVPGSTHKYMRAGDYMASLTVVNANGCMDSYTDTVTRGSCLVAAYINVSDTLCQNLQIGFTDMSKCEGTISNWVWTFGDLTPPTTYTVYQPQVFHTYDTAGVYTVKLRVSTVVGASTISDSTSRTILVKPSPLAGFNVAPSCLGSKTHFNNTTQANGAAALSYRWDFGDAGTADTSLLKSPEYLYPIAGVYTTMMKAINQQGCWDTVSSLIRVNGLPEARFSNNPPCSQQIVQFVDSSLAYIAPVVSWHWRVSDSLGLLAILQGDTVSYVFDSTGRYNVQLLVADTNGCSDTLTQWITVNRSPVSAFSFTENVDDIQGHIQFTNGSIGSVQYNWDFGNGENSYAESPLMTYADDGDYPVILVSTSKEGCNDTALLIYKMLFKGLYVPNAFAPEGMASETRIWKPVGVNLESYQCEIFNSYGALVWSSIKLDSWGAPLEGWEGYYMDNNNTSHKCPQDVYVWKITAKFRDGTIWTNKDVGEHEGLSEPVWGTLTLIR